MSLSFVIHLLSFFNTNLQVCCPHTLSLICQQLTLHHLQQSLHQYIWYNFTSLPKFVSPISNPSISYHFKCGSSIPLQVPLCRGFFYLLQAVMFKLEYTELRIWHYKETSLVMGEAFIVIFIVLVVCSLYLARIGYVLYFICVVIVFMERDEIVTSLK